MGSGFFGKGSDCAQVFVSQLPKFGPPIPWIWVWKRLLPLKFTIIQKLVDKCNIFVVEYCVVNFHSNITLCIMFGVT